MTTVKGKYVATGPNIVLGPENDNRPLKEIPCSICGEPVEIFADVEIAGFVCDECFSSTL